MAEYIEREAFREVLKKSHEAHISNSREGVLLDRDIRLLNEQPAADVVEVTRCKDCKYREVCRTTNIRAVPPGDEWYCADGERGDQDAEV